MRAQCVQRLLTVPADTAHATLLYCCDCVTAHTCTLTQHSGDVLAAADTGSITMFDTPQQFGEHCLDENFMHTVTLAELYARRTCLRSSAQYQPDVVSAGTAVLRERITALRDH
eukprot:6719-Heterococcus_DN1.PRE.7